MTDYPKRLIEVDLPIKRISAHARREKSIRHGHISTLHIWWARRPLAACRAVICAALWPDPADKLCPQAFRDHAAAIIAEFAGKAASQKNLMEHCSDETRSKWIFLSRSENRIDPHDEAHLNVLRNALLDFIADFANWDNSTQPDYLEASRLLTRVAHLSLEGIELPILDLRLPIGEQIANLKSQIENLPRPLVVDPFAGGGSIPLEALRVGADAFASDLNPVAVLLNKVVLEYIPKYGQRLADEVRKWGEWIKKEAEKELAEFYPKDEDGATPIAYLWARTIQCEGPGCGAEVPIITQPLLAERKTTRVFLNCVADTVKKTIAVNVLHRAKTEEIGKGTVQRSSVTCPVCGYTTPAANVRKQFTGRKGGSHDARLLSVVTISAERGKDYRAPTDADRAIAERANLQVSKKAARNLPAIPDEPLPYLRSIFNIHLLGVHEWGQLFTPKQALLLATFARIVSERSQTLHLDSLDAAVMTCLGLALDKMADFHTSLACWIHQGEKVGHTFGRQALGIIWDYAEANPFGNISGSWDRCVSYVSEVIEHNQCLAHMGSTQKASATEHPLPNDSTAAFITDPPYYDAVPYADLSDFFYVWLKRSIGNLHETLFLETTSPKEMEVVQLAERNDLYAYKTRENFERRMANALSEGRRITVPFGVGVIVFAHKTTQAWETMLQAVIDAGWIVVASWPIDTERQGRLRAMDSAALASSVHLVCRSRENPDGSLREDIGDWRDVLQELPRRIHEWMPRLAQEGVVGADAIFACLGPALEIFSRYSRVEKASGEQVTLREYLEYVWAAVAKEALTMIFEGADATGFEEDARLTAMWLWTLGFSSADLRLPIADSEDGEEPEDDKSQIANQKSKISYSLEYDAARKIAQGLGVYLEKLDNLVEIKGDTARLLSVAERTRYLFGKDNAEAPAAKRKKKAPQLKLAFIEELEQAEAEEGWGQKDAPRPGSTTLDRVHQSMILFAAGRAEAMKRFLVEEGAGDARFWRLAQAFAALYPSGTDEKRWVEGVLARKKSLGF